MPKQEGLHLENTKVFFNTLYELVQYYMTESSYMLRAAPTDVTGEALSVMNRVDNVALTSQYFLGGVSSDVV